MNARLIAALAGMTLLFSATAAPAQTTMAPGPGSAIGPTAAPVPLPVGSAAPATAIRPATGPLALDARKLHGMRTRTGYRLTGQALVKDACTAARFARFLGNIFPPQYDAVQYRRPGTQGLLCALRATWVIVVPLDVTSAAPPRYVTVRTQKGSTRVPLLPLPVPTE
jgi:hypothetical protein